MNIDGGLFHHNYIRYPGDWAFRLLNENVGKPIVETQNGAMMDNVIIFRGDSWKRAGNYDGSGVLEDTFHFARNQWINADDPTAAGSTPELPSVEIEGIYGGDPTSLPQPPVWDFPWGKWAVNSTTSAGSVSIEDPEFFLLAVPMETAKFDPLAADPLQGAWSFFPAASSYEMDSLSQLILVRPGASTAIPDIPGDYDRSGAVDIEDYGLWKRQIWIAAAALADGNGDGQVSLADFTSWRDHLGATAGSAAMTQSVPTPSAQECSWYLIFGALICTHPACRY